MEVIELEKIDWVYWDLLMVTKLKPENQEVSMKLEEVKKLSMQ